MTWIDDYRRDRMNAATRTLQSDIPIKRYPAQFGQSSPQSRQIVLNQKGDAIQQLAATIEALIENCPDWDTVQFLTDYDFGQYRLDLFFSGAMLAVEVGRFTAEESLWLQERFIRQVEVSEGQALKQSFPTAQMILVRARELTSRFSGFGEKATRASLRPAGVLPAHFQNGMDAQP